MKGLCNKTLTWIPSFSISMMDGTYHDEDGNVIGKWEMTGYGTGNKHDFSMRWGDLDDDEIAVIKGRNKIQRMSL